MSFLNFNIFDFCNILLFIEKNYVKFCTSAFCTFYKIVASGWKSISIDIKISSQYTQIFSAKLIDIINIKI